MANTYDPSATVYRFQKTMAKRGNAESQFKLGLMFETGSGVEKGLVSAILWYKKAADQNYKPAINRLTYIDIKKSGFKNSHKQWVKDLQADAQFNEGEALFLLGQMHSEGTGIEKDLTKALKLLRKASRSDIPGSDAEIARIEKELAMLDEKSTKKKKNSAATIALIAAKIASIKPIPPLPAGQVNVPKKAFVTAAQLRKQQARARQIKRDKELRKNQKNKPLAPTLVPNKPAKIQKIPPQNLPPIASTKPLPFDITKPVNDTEQHPMDIICGGRNMLLSGCR